jgi:hypothetical protein
MRKPQALSAWPETSLAFRATANSAGSDDLAGRKQRLLEPHQEQCQAAGHWRNSAAQTSTLTVCLPTPEVATLRISANHPYFDCKRGKRPGTARKLGSLKHR